MMMHGKCTALCWPRHSLRQLEAKPKPSSLCLLLVMTCCSIALLVLCLFQL